MTTTLTENDLPLDATYTVIENGGRVCIYFYRDGKCFFLHEGQVFLSADKRDSNERDATRDEAIAILKARGQLAAPAEPRPFKVGDRVRVVRKATKDEELESVSWIFDDMDKCVGKVGVITEIGREHEELKAARVKVDGVEWNYPACVLAHADRDATEADRLIARADEPVVDVRMVSVQKPVTFIDGKSVADNRIYCDHPGCGKDITPSGGTLNHAELKAGLGSSTYCDEHQSAKAKPDQSTLEDDLVRECERAIKQRDEFLKTGVSTASHGGSHDTCFGAVLRRHGVLQYTTVAAQPDPLADLRRRVEALEEVAPGDGSPRLATWQECFSDMHKRLEAIEAACTSEARASHAAAWLGVSDAEFAKIQEQVRADYAKASPTAPPVPPVPEVPECGYWERDGKRYVLTEPVEWRNAKSGEAIVYEHVAGIFKAILATQDHTYQNFILRELVEPTPPQGYEIDGWRKPKAEQWFICDGMPVRDDRDEDVFRWCLRPKPTVRRKTETVTFDFGNTSAELPFVNTGDGWKVDRELIGVEWALEWLESNGHASSAWAIWMHARLAEIRAGK